MVHRGILDLKRFQSGERFSSCLPESTVNAVINKSFAKRQQIQCTNGARTCGCKPERRPSMARSGRPEPPNPPLVRER